MRGAEAEIAIVPVPDPEQILAVVIPAAGFAPQIGGDDHGHEHFLRAGPIHLRPHDAGGLVQGAQTQGKPGVNAAGQLADHASADKQLVADDFGVAGGFFQSGNVGMAPAHEDTSRNGFAFIFAAW